MDIQEAAHEVIRALGLPRDGMILTIEDGHMLIGNSDLAFAITKKRVDEGQHVATALYMFPRLLEIIKEREQEQEDSR